MTLTQEAPAAGDAEEALKPFPVTIIVRRFDPETMEEPVWQDFDVQMYPTDRILDALHQIKWEQDGTLAFHGYSPRAARVAPLLGAVARLPLCASMWRAGDRQRPPKLQLANSLIARRGLFGS